MPYYLSKSLHLLIMAGVFVACCAGDALAEGAWLKPVIAVSEQYDDNIFLTPSNTTSDTVTTVTAGVLLEPKLSRHELRIGYGGLFEFFADNSGQNTDNHRVQGEAVLNFNQWRVELSNTFSAFENRTGTEDTARIPRLNNHSGIGVIYQFNKMDLGLRYKYRHEDYRSNDPIGDFLGQSLTYQDLDSDENSAELELALKLWPKTALLLSGRYGKLSYDSGRKSDSDYFDILTGLRGEFFTKGEIEGKIGFRSQDYESFAADFDEIIFLITLTENFTPRDTLTIDLERTTNTTIEQENAYFEGTELAIAYIHKFTERIAAKLRASYRINDYPAAITVGGQTGTRKDKIWLAGIGFNYTLTGGVEISLAYDFGQRDSKFDTNDYDNNLVSLRVSLPF
ncbi:MAG: outer membrane beta-barrel protein [Candidatus Omnitrophica bacterium]|nr:outer membrane beta-barrel protein [Candidatus Omnitrophota bacterium]